MYDTDIGIMMKFSAGKADVFVPLTLIVIFLKRKHMTRKLTKVYLHYLKR